MSQRNQSGNRQQQQAEIVTAEGQGENQSRPNVNRYKEISLFLLKPQLLQQNCQLMKCLPSDPNCLSQMFLLPNFAHNNKMKYDVVVLPTEA
jgi:hypothetical protein